MTTVEPKDSRKDKSQYNLKTNMTLIKIHEVWKDEKTGITATVYMDGHISIDNYRGRQDFVFRRSDYATTKEVAEAILRLAELIPDVEEAAHPMRKLHVNHLD